MMQKTQQGLLSEFGQISRKLRISKGYTMADQSEALHHAPSDISAFETGKFRPSINYINEFAKWVGADIFTHESLLRSSKNSGNVISLDGARSQRKLFRKFNSLTPSQVRALRVPRELDHVKEPPDDR